MRKTIVAHWQFRSGELDPLPEFPSHTQTLLQAIREPHPRGYTCWVYPADEHAFVSWMKENMLGSYDCTWRFNGGDIMYTVYIEEDEDANLFTLRWR